MRRPRPPRIYAIADAEMLARIPLADAVEAMADAGIEWIQLRAKDLPGESLRRAAERCCRRLEGTAARLWIDDRGDVAALTPVSGLHVGQRDLPPRAARKVVGPQMWIGQSTHDRNQLVAAADDPEVDVVAVGPVFSTRSKRQPDPTVGLDLVRTARRVTRKPIVAIGGIDETNLGAVLEAGADTVAVLSAACVGSPAASCRRLLRAAGAWA